MAQSRFNCLDVFLTILSLLTFIVDVGTDVAVTVLYFLDNNWLWGGLMLALTVVSLVVMNGFSLKWNSTDGSLSWTTILIHVFLVAPIQRYLRVIYLGIKSCLTCHPKYKDAALREQNDASILRLFETFLESAPQLVLQLYILLLNTHNVRWLQVLSAASSLVSLGWALTAYSDTLRLNYQSTYLRHCVALLLHNCWQICMAACRVTALVLFASVFQGWILLFSGLHWAAMTVWIWLKGTNFGQGCMERALFRVVSGCMYIFVYINVHDGPSRGRMTAYYCVLFLENCLLYALWLIYSQPGVAMKIGASLLVFGCFVFGGICMVVYYRWLHPSGPNYMFCVKATIPSTLPQQTDITVEHHSQTALMAPSSPYRNETLEVSIECEAPSEDAVTSKTVSSAIKGASASQLSQLLDSSTKDALETAWQSGMGSSSSCSSNSSLAEDDCSLDEFGTTMRSPYGPLLEKSLSRSCSPAKRSARRLLSPPQSDAACQAETDVTIAVSSSGGHMDSPFNRSQRSNITVRERIIESEHESLHTSQREAADGTEEIESYSGSQYRRRSQGQQSGQNFINTFSLLSDSSQASSFTNGVEETSPEVRLTGGGGSVGQTPRPQAADTRQALGRINSVAPPSPPGHISYWSKDKNWQAEPSARLDTISSANTKRFEQQGPSRPCRSFDVEADETPSVSPLRNAGEAPLTPPSCLDTPLFTPEETPFTSPQMQEKVAKDGEKHSQSGGSQACEQREAMASYPVSVDSSPADNPKSHLVYEDDSERAGGESLWGASPNTSNSSTSRSSNGPDPSVSFPASRQRPRIVDSFDSESESSCVKNADKFHAMARRNGDRIQQAEHRRLEILKREEFPVKSPSGKPFLTPVGRSPEASNDVDAETSWNSMKVNEDELSGLENLRNLTPDDSLCLFASNDQGETPRPCCDAQDQGSQRWYHREAPISRASTPSLPRSRSASSLYYDFHSAGVSPSPPPGLKSASLSRNHSYIDTPCRGASRSPTRQSRQDSAHWQLDYLNLDPAPPVLLRDRHDPREVIIELLMDQLKKSSVQSRVPRSRPLSSNLSRLHSSDMEGSHRLAGGFAEAPSQQNWRQYTKQDPNTTLQGHFDLNRSMRNDDIDLMRKALDLIEMNRSSATNFDQLTSSSGSSPEMYVSGQYRPPIVSLPDRVKEAQPSTLSQAIERSLVTPRGRPDSFAAHRLSQSGSLPGHFRHDLPQMLDRKLSQASLTSPLANCQFSQTLPAGERQGIYRYFVDSDSPIHTPLWNTTPHITPSVQPLLHHYLNHNHIQQATHSLVPDLLPASEPRCTFPLAGGSGRDRNMGTFIYTETEGRGMRDRELRRSAALEVVVDPDSGMHSDSHSAASRRQPLQSLDSNSPSLSPSSATQQPAYRPHKPLKGRSPSGSRSGSSSQASVLQPRSAKAVATARSRLREGTATASSSIVYTRGRGRPDNLPTLTDTDVKNSLTSKTRSADCLR